MADDADQEAMRVRRQRLRSIAIALGLGFLVLLFYAATIVRMGGNHGAAVGEFGPAKGGQEIQGAEPKGSAP